MNYTKEKPLRVVTLCSGYDSQCLAFERLKRDYPDFDYELVAWAEYDPETPKTPLNKHDNLSALADAVYCFDITEGRIEG